MAHPHRIALAQLRENRIDLERAIDDALDTLDWSDAIAVGRLAALTAQYRATRAALARHELREVPRCG